MKGETISAADDLLNNPFGNGINNWLEERAPAAYTHSHSQGTRILGGVYIFTWGIFSARRHRIAAANQLETVVCSSLLLGQRR